MPIILYNKTHKMTEKNTTEQKLRKENTNLKKALAVCLNKPLMKQIDRALVRIDRGEYISESEFLKTSPLMA